MIDQHIDQHRVTSGPEAHASAFAAPAVASPAVARARLRITRRGRGVLAVLGALPIVAGAFAFGLNGGGAVASGESSDVRFQYVTVRAGESLWSLAEDIAPGSDPRDVVSDLLSLNQLSSAGLEPGQRLAVPSGYELTR